MTDKPRDPAEASPSGAEEEGPPPSGDTTARSDPDPIADDGTSTTAHVATRPTPFDATVISQRTPDQRPSIMAPLPQPMSMTELGKQLVGVQLNHYFLQQLIGGGGMGVVFQALDTQLNRIVALKLLTAQYGEDEEEARRFELEAQSAARLNHENIAHVYDLGEADGWRYIVFEYIEGQNLRDVVHEAGALSIEDTIVFTLQIAEALDHASNRDLVHRDIKPSNVIITPAGQAKLVDMGLARLRHVERDVEDLTASGVALGTFDYISPEQGSDPRAADVRSDLYSLGCTMFFMLASRPPFPNGTAIQKVLHHTSTPPPDLRQFRTDIPESLLAIVNQLLEKDPDRRFQHPRLLTSALVDLADSRHLAPRSWRHERPGGHSRFVRHAPWLLALALLAVVVGGIEYRLAPQTGEPTTLPNIRLPQLDGNQPPANSEVTTSNELSTPPLRIPNPKPIKQATGNLENPPEPADMGVSSGVTTASLNQPSVDPSRLISPGTVLVVPSSWRAAVDNLSIFDSPRAALAAAEQNQAIRRVELAVTGRFQIDPLRLADRELELVASSGCWPILLPQRSGPARPGGLADGLINVRSGMLRIDGVHFEIVQPPGNRENALFQLDEVESLELRRCWITGRADPPLSLVRVLGNDQPPGAVDADPDELPVDTGAILATAVLMTDCVVRGQLRVIDATSDQPVKLSWTNGMLCTTERLGRFTGSTQPRTGGQHQIDLDHLTALMDRGLVEIVAAVDRPHLLTLDMNCTRSIFVTQPTAQFIQLQGQPSATRYLESRLFFGGQRNFYEGVVSFWNEGLGDSEPAANFAAWQQRWSASENLAQHNRVLWRAPAHLNRLRDQLTPALLRLDGSPANPARSAAGGIDRNDAGFRSEQLPYPVVGRIPRIPGR